MENFVCGNCKFKFRAEKGARCPYCDRKDSVEREKSASELLNEVPNLME